MTQVDDMVIGKLTSAQVRSVLAAAARAPSPHNTQPWRFHRTATTIELHADPDRALPVADPDRRELMVACGAALLNLRLAIRAQGCVVSVRLLPSAAQQNLLAVVKPMRSRIATTEEQRLAGAIDRRRTNRYPFTHAAVPVPVRNELRRAAESEQARMATVRHTQLPALRSLVHTAHRIQQHDGDFLAEWRSWVGRGADTFDGVPRYSAGPRPETGDVWVLRDFALGRGEARLPGHDFEPDPLLVVVGSADDTPLGWLRAGQALQRVLLTATTAGLAASFLAQVVEVAPARARLRALLDNALWPQAVLRLGYGSWPVPPTPRRPADDYVP